MDNQPVTLDSLRVKIDQLDQSILDLISQRARCAQQVAEVKKEQGGPLVYYRPEREAQVLRKIKEANKGPLADEDMARLFREIMSACLALEEPVKVAFLGPEGTHTQRAVLKHFGQAAVCLPQISIAEVFREVESGQAQFGLVPVENSTEGVVNHTLDSFVKSNLKICGEVELRIHNHLLAHPDTDPENITRIYSHQQPLAQCRHWLDTHYLHSERAAVSSTSEAAKRAANEIGNAAIASEMAAQIYDLKTIASNIEDEPDNTTRFLVIGHYAPPPSGEDKTSLMVSTANKPGALHYLLEPFAKSDVSMSRIESRPSRNGMWDYVFFIDIEGHQDDAAIQQVLTELNRNTSIMKVLGSYPRAVL
jgi:chorismate mutase/prephenate dehydratase